MALNEVLQSSLNLIKMQGNFRTLAFLLCDKFIQTTWLFWHAFPEHTLTAEKLTDLQHRLEKRKVEQHNICWYVLPTNYFGKLHCMSKL